MYFRWLQLASNTNRGEYLNPVILKSLKSIASGGEDENETEIPGKLFILLINFFNRSRVSFLASIPIAVFPLSIERVLITLFNCHLPTSNISLQFLHTSNRSVMIRIL